MDEFVVVIQRTPDRHHEGSGVDPEVSAEFVALLDRAEPILARVDRARMGAEVLTCLDSLRATRWKHFAVTVNSRRRHLDCLSAHFLSAGAVGIQVSVTSFPLASKMPTPGM